MDARAHRQPVAVRAKSGPFTKEDESRFWFVDFHWPRGFSPLGYLYVTDCASWAHPDRRAPAAAAARRRASCSAWAGRSSTRARCRSTSQWEIGFRAARIEKNMPQVPPELRRHLGGAQVGARARARATSRATTSPASRSPRSASTWSTPAPSTSGRGRSTSRSCTRCSAIYLAAVRACARRTGSTRATSPRCFQGRDSKIMETDRAMWDLVDEAKRLGIAELLRRTSLSRSATASPKAGGNASIWLTKFDDFLKEYGWRTEGIADINIPSWIENQASPLGQIRNFLSMDERARLRRGAGRLARASATRRSTPHVRSSAARRSARSTSCSAIAPVANFAWWNEDHNYYIDLRASIPLRRGALAARAPRSAPTTTTTRSSSSIPSSSTCAAGDAAVEGRAVDRHGPPRVLRPLPGDPRARMPKVVGTLPDKVEDPVLIEIFGMHNHYFERLKADPQHDPMLNGFPASAGTVHRPGSGDGVGDRAVRPARRARSSSPRRPRRTGRRRSPSSAPACATAVARSPTPRP